MAWPVGIPKNMTAEQRVERARNASLARTTVDHHIRMLEGKTLTPSQWEALMDILAKTEPPNAAS